MTSKNTMMVGVGGQGTFPTSRILGKLVIGVGFDMKLSKVYGIARRGNSVMTFVRYGGKVVEPIVEKGRADVPIIFKRLEALRCLHFLRKDGVIIASDWRIDPITVMTGVAQYPEGITGRLKEVRRTIMVGAAEEAKKMGVPKAFNVIVLGAIAKHMGFEKEDWPKVIGATAPPKAMETNKKAFETGHTLSV